MKRNPKQYDTGKISKLWPYLVELHEKRPEIFENATTLKSTVAVPWPALKDPKHCANCGESMQIYSVKLNYHEALLLTSMGRIFRERFNGGMNFTEANKIHIVSSDLSFAVKASASHARTLGLIAKVLTVDKKHDRSKGWLITSRGFEALAGKPVPAEVHVFRNKIEERTDRTTTLKDAFASQRPPDYSPEHYYEIVGIKTDTIL